ncbi:MAG: hypothetical protein JO211_08305 [Acidobacteriaceae bacterium]|nr:hypothetical protein [Acidobacteriaceae bacterium]
MVALTLVLGVVYQTPHFDKRYEDLREHFNKRFDDQRDFIKSEVARLDNRQERLGHPIYRS